MRGEGQGSGGHTVTFRNIRVEDPRPTLQHFKILLQGKNSFDYLFIFHIFILLQECSPG